jgi:hypothetical protein
MMAPHDGSQKFALRERRTYGLLFESQRKIYGEAGLRLGFD